MISHAVPSSAVLFSVFLLSVTLSFDKVHSIRFTLDKKECFTHHVEEEGAMIHGSFVVVSSDNGWPSSFEKAGVDLVVEAPVGYHVYAARERTEDKFTFVAVRKGDYKFCFTNHSPIHESIAFEVYSGHHVSPHHEEVAKDEHFDPLMEHVQELEDTLMNVFYECRWLFAQAERQAELSKITSRRLVMKAFLQSFALIGASTLQVYLLRRLFEKKLKQSRV